MLRFSEEQNNRIENGNISKYFTTNKHFANMKRLYTNKYFNYFYFGFDRLIESRRHIVALSTIKINKLKTLDEI